MAYWSSVLCIDNGPRGMGIVKESSAIITSAGHQHSGENSVGHFRFGAFGAALFRCPRPARRITKKQPFGFQMLGPTSTWHSEPAQLLRVPKLSSVEQNS